MPRKATGNVRQHASGWWEARTTRDGQTISRYGRTAEEANAKLREALSVTKDAGISLHHLLDEWLKDGRTRWKPYTLHHHEGAVKQIKKVMADLPVTSISRGVLRDFRQALADQPYKQWDLWRYLHAAFSYAVEWELIPYHPMEGIKRPIYHYKEKQVWTREQTRRFLAGVGDQQYAPLFIFALATGCRISEITALRWDDIDFENGTVVVNKGTVHFKGHWITSSPKTKAGVRSLVLPSFVTAALKRQQKWQDQFKGLPCYQNNDMLVFTTSSGHCLDRAEVSHVLKDYCRQLELPEITPHALRHLSGSLALSAGASLAEVSRHLGHASIAITADVYLHHVTDNTAVAEALNRVLSDQANTTGVQLPD